MCICQTPFLICKEVKHPLPQQRVIQTNLRIFVGFYEKKKATKMNLSSVTVGQVIESDTLLWWHFILWGPFVNILVLWVQAHCCILNKIFYVGLDGTNQRSCQPADIPRGPRGCRALSALASVRDKYSAHNEIKMTCFFPISNISASVK